MAGLLDDIIGDDITKDDLGMTQRDRRMPIWAGLLSGLSRSGAALVAAGAPTKDPGDSARYLAQAGTGFAEGVGGIPKAMMDQRSDAARQKLQGLQGQQAAQTVALGKQKLENQAKMAAYAQSEEGKAAMAGMQPHQQFAVKVAIDTGDVDAFQRLVSGIDKNELGIANLQVAQARAETARLKAEQAGSGWGNTLEGRMRDALAKGKEDPAFALTDKYAEAWHYFNQDQRPVVSGGQTIILPKRPDIDDYPRPGAKAAPGSPGAAAAPQAALAPGQVQTNPDKSQTWLDPATGDRLTEYPDGRLLVERDGKRIRVDEPKPPDPIALRKLGDLKENEAKVNVAKADFLREWNKQSPADRARALAGGTTTATAAWTVLANLVKEAGVFNLGVITGPDLMLLQRVIADPASMRSLGLKPEEVAEMVEKISRVQAAGIKQHEQNVLRPSRAPKADGGGGKVRTYNPNTGEFE